MDEILESEALLDEIRVFIDEKWKHGACELCDTDGWMIYPEPTTHIHLSAGGERGPQPGAAQRIVTFLPIGCRNCGNLRLIDARIFEKWREARRTGSTSPISRG